jgi:hypothetical protein
VFVFKSAVNSFHYLYGDAEFFHQVARNQSGDFAAVRAARTALLLYILSLEALINRALEHFLPEHLRQFLLDREEKLTIEDKWLLLPLLTSADPSRHFDRSRYPWSHFAELIKIRNEFVHPKHDRLAYYEAMSATQWRPLSWNNIPNGLGVKETDVVFRQTRIPRDPYAVRLNHVDTVREVVDATIEELDRLLDGRILKDGWSHSDGMGLIWPPGATLQDLPPTPAGGGRV